MYLFCTARAEVFLFVVCRARSQNHQGGGRKKPPKNKKPLKNKKPEDFWNYTIFGNFCAPTGRRTSHFWTFQDSIRFKIYGLINFDNHRYALMYKCLCRQPSVPKQELHFPETQLFWHLSRRSPESSVYYYWAARNPWAALRSDFGGPGGSERFFPEAPSTLPTQRLESLLRAHKEFGEKLGI